MKPTTVKTQLATSLFGRWVEKFLATVDRGVPTGYENETGFHYGEPSGRGRHIVRFFHPEPPTGHARYYHTRHAPSGFHSYQLTTREVPYQ